MATSSEKYSHGVKGRAAEINMIARGYPTITIENGVSNNFTPFPDDFTYINANIVVVYLDVHTRQPDNFCDCRGE